MNLILLEFQCLKHMFGCLHSGIITEEAYDRLIKCIGPFIEGGEVIDQVRALLEMPYASALSFIIFLNSTY